MRKPIVVVSLLLLAASPVLGEDGAPAGVTTVEPAATPPATAAPAATPPATAAPTPPSPPKTLAGIGRRVTRTITALMRQLAESRIPPQARSGLNQRLLVVQAQVSAAVQAGQAPAGEDVEGFSALLGKDLDAIAGAIDSASRRRP